MTNNAPVFGTIEEFAKHQEIEGFPITMIGTKVDKYVFVATGPDSGCNTCSACDDDLDAELCCSSDCTAGSRLDGLFAEWVVCGERESNGTDDLVKMPDSVPAVVEASERTTLRGGTTDEDIAKCYPTGRE